MSDNYQNLVDELVANTRVKKEIIFKYLHALSPHQVAAAIAEAASIVDAEVENEAALK